ncbi:MAG: hypothetical protein RBU45_03825 [Myxococcota bacterium]|jgi:hypothetical protein|nr:hypothetical protein [Myxococcota bacterium]
MRRWHLVVVLGALVLALGGSGCGEDGGGSEGEGEGEGAEGEGEGGEPLSGFGLLSGECGVLDDELTSAGSALVLNHLDFGSDPYDEADRDLLSPGGQEILADGNAGGGSLLSEVFAYEVLYRCEGAELLKTETEIVYEGQGKLTDLLVGLDGLKIGVSVTRAVGWPREDPYPVDRAKALLEDKLSDVQASSGHVAAEDRWAKQILHVIAYGEGHAESVRTAFTQIDEGIIGDTVVVVTVTDGDDAFLY